MKKGIKVSMKFNIVYPLSGNALVRYLQNEWMPELDLSIHTYIGSNKDTGAREIGKIFEIFVGTQDPRPFIPTCNCTYNSTKCLNRTMSSGQLLNHKLMTSVCLLNVAEAGLNLYLAV